MLNPFLFFRRRKSKFLLIVSIMSISIFCIYFISTLMQSILSTCESTALTPLKYFSTVLYNPSDSELSQTEVENELLEHVSEADCTSVVFQMIDVNALIGTTSAYSMYFQSSDDLLVFMDEFGIVLNNGRIPEESTNELILHENIMKNKGLSIGEELNNCTITGTFLGDTQISMGLLSDSRWNQASQTRYDFLLTPNNGYSIDEVNQSIELNLNDDYHLITYSEMEREFSDTFGQFRLILSIVTIMVSLCISIAVAALAVSIYTARYEEFAIINALGYKKTKIYKLVIVEIVSVSIFAWLVGYAISVVGALVLNQLIFNSLGQSIALLNTDALIYSCILPVLTMVITVSPIIRKLHKTDLIQVIEGR